ncbi:MAG: hypothetical protein HY067_16280 [Betaproteobacteria bacterium]|nr:hypothetical protein [Betaproteobacteria bacterium]
MKHEVIQGQVCTGFEVSRDGTRFRLQLIDNEGRALALEFPTASLDSLMRVLPEIQQVALPRGRGNKALRIIRSPEAWSLERDLADDSLLLVLITSGGFEWCFHLDDVEVFKMATYLRDERAVTLPAPDIRQ